MNDWYERFGFKMDFGSDEASSVGSYGYSDKFAEIWAVTQEPRVRWRDVPGGDALAEQLALNPDDSALREVFELTLREQLSKAMTSNNPFWGNYPNADDLPPVAPGVLPVCSLPTGSVLSIPIEATVKNILICGPTGGGKTTWLRLMLAFMLANMQSERETMP